MLRGFIPQQFSKFSFLLTADICRPNDTNFYRYVILYNYEGRTESHEQFFFACELGTADEGECGGR